MKRNVVLCSTALAASGGLMLLGLGMAYADSDAEVLERIHPIGKVNTAPAPAVQSAAPTAKPAPADNPAPVAKATPVENAAPVTPAAAVAANTGDTGKKIYESGCFACHGMGVMGAPKVGDQAAWAPRTAKGMEALLHSALNGIRAMPPRGACGTCSDEDLKAAVEYMVSNSK